MKWKKTILFVGAAFLVLGKAAGWGPEDTAHAPIDDKIYLPVIMYHEVKLNHAGKDAIQPWELEQDLKYLSEHDYHAITMTELVDYVCNDVALPPNPIVLSFDDGYRNNYVYALPLLEKYDMKMVFSIIGKSIEEYSNSPCSQAEYAYVSWDELNEMLDSGYVEVQNQTYNLHSYNTKGRIGCAQKSDESDMEYEQLLTRDIGGLQALIELKTGKTPNTFTYPYGKCSDNTDRILKKLGFEATLSCEYGINIITKNPEDLYCLKRIVRPHGQSIKQVLQAGYETLKYR